MISSISEKIVERFQKNLQRHFKNTMPAGNQELKLFYKKGVLNIVAGKQEINLGIYKQNACELYNFTSCTETDPGELKIHIAQDQLARRELQMFSIIRAKLQLNTKIFARKCQVKRINTTYAKFFLDAHHLMEYASAAFHYGLFFDEELIAVAAFSKGRKMDRLPADKRSFELVRFCCKEGITVTGGLSKLLQHFIEEKEAGDIMTYVDKQWSFGSGYLKCGFKLLGETKKQEFIVNKITFERSNFKGEKYDPKKFYTVQNSGNLKLIYTVE